MRLGFSFPEEGSCNVCGRQSYDISAFLGVCRSCILNDWDEAATWVRRAHAESRREFSLPSTPPHNGKACGGCVNDCRIPEDGKGYCGVRGNLQGRILPLTDGAVVEWYYDLLPTNCVAAFVCPECLSPKPRRKNLAVFYGACTFDCLFCQNWTYRRNTSSLSPVLGPEMLASKEDPDVACVCYFGGDPTPQISHALDTSRILMEKRQDIRICFETNGSMTKSWLRKVAQVAYDSGGIIKIDLKAWHEKLNIALCGASNRQTLSNFRWLVEYGQKRGYRGYPFVVASTLLVPGYVIADEVSLISKFLAEIDVNIPYSLLAFHPAFRMTDMERATRDQAIACKEAAMEHGLKLVKIGNVHLLH